MDEDRIYDKINMLLEDTDYPFEISDISGIEHFLNNEDNERFEIYNQVEDLYNQLVDFY